MFTCRTRGFTVIVRAPKIRLISVATYVARENTSASIPIHLNESISGKNLEKLEFSKRKSGSFFFRKAVPLKNLKISMFLSKI